MTGPEAVGEAMTEGGAQGAYPRGWRRYLYATNHKDVGTMFLLLALLCGVIGMVFAFYMRAELMQPGLQVFADERAYQVALTGHGTFMILFCAIPSVLGLAAWLVPLSIGAPGLAFPRLSNLSFWLMPFAVLMCLMSFRMPSHGVALGVAAGWNLRVPLSSYGAFGPAVDFFLVGELMWAISVLMAVINFLTTILNMRAPGMGLGKMPLFPWSVMAFSLLLLVALPALFCAGILLFADRHFGTTLFNAAGGGDPQVYQNLFWLFGHAIGLACLLPGLGIIGHVLSAFSGRPLSGRMSVAYAIFVLGGLGLFGWGMHLGCFGNDGDLQSFFMIAGMAVFLPAGVIMAAYLSTLWGGAIRFRAPMIWALGFLPVFAVGIMGGLIMTCIGTHSVLHGSAFEVAYGHYFVSLSFMFAFFSGWYFWFPKFTGLTYNEVLAKAHFWLTFVGGNMAFLPMFWLGLAGMPRGVADYPAVYGGWNRVVGYGSCLVGLGLAVFLVTMALALWEKHLSGSNPWGRGVSGLEWQLSSPPPYRTYDELPHIR